MLNPPSLNVTNSDAPVPAMPAMPEDDVPDFVPSPYVKRLFLDGALGSQILEVRRHLRYFTYVGTDEYLYTYFLKTTEDGHQYFKLINAVPTNLAFKDKQ
jgi:hypothetical protein